MDAILLFGLSAITCRLSLARKRVVPKQLGLFLESAAEGSFRANRHSALKILTADSYGGEKDTYELSVLEHIKATDSFNPGAQHILGLLDHFKHQGPNGEHVCFIFKAMGPDLATYRQLFPKSRIPIRTLKRFTRQLLLALAYLHQSCRIIHTGKSTGQEMAVGNSGS